jgi:hypothetical protein
MNRQLNRKYTNIFKLIFLFQDSKYKLKKVCFKLNGDLNETGIRLLNDGYENRVLKESSVDSFIMAVQK